MTDISSKLMKAYMNIAHEFAQCSSANRLKVGAVMVKNSNIISFSYNGTPYGWDNVCEDEHGLTHKYVLHAESNLLMKVAKHGGCGSDGSVVFVTHSPCYDCAKLLYQAGVKEVYYATPYRLTEGIEFLRKAGIKVEHYPRNKSDFDETSVSTTSSILYLSK